MVIVHKMQICSEQTIPARHC